MRKLTITFLTLTYFSITILQAQNLEYDIVWLGKIGKLSINKVEENGTIRIETNSEVKIPFYTFSWITHTQAINGQLQSSKYQQLLNNKDREGSEIKFLYANKRHFINSDGKAELITLGELSYVSMLYYQEPIDQVYIFSERFGKPLEILNEGNGHYRLLLPDDNYCDYFYENGVCKLVKAKNGNRTIKMVLSEGS